jgi:hypothetical protein
MSINVEGSCTCGEIQFCLTAEPLIVHGCHCRWCQRETGGAFAINALIERANIHVLSGTPAIVPTPSESGNNQDIVRCPSCQVALWSHYAGAGPAIAFVRVGTLQNPDRFPPDIHIYTASKQPWLELPSGAKSVPEFYKPRKVWTPETASRYKAALRSGR